MTDNDLGNVVPFLMAVSSRSANESKLDVPGLIPELVQDVRGGQVALVEESQPISAEEQSKL